MDPQVSAEEGNEKPRFWQLSWWKQFFSAAKFWKYSAREWGVFSYGAYTAVKGVISFSFIKSLSWGAVKTFLGKAVAFVGALVAIAVN